MGLTKVASGIIMAIAFLAFGILWVTATSTIGVPGFFSAIGIAIVIIGILISVRSIIRSVR